MNMALVFHFQPDCNVFLVYAQIEMQSSSQLADKQTEACSHARGCWVNLKPDWLENGLPQVGGPVQKLIG